VVIYDPTKTGTGNIEGEEVGLSLDTVAHKAGFSITILSKENSRNDLVSKLTQVFNGTAESPTSLKRIEKMTIAGYPAAKFVIAEPLREMQMYAAWRDDIYGYWVTPISYNREGEDKIMRTHEVILDHLLDTFQSNNNI